MPIFALTIFTGAFLLFLVQPLMGKYILPWFGGTPAVWTACMLFFQVALLGGYAYAHYSRERLSLRGQALLHIALLLAALLVLPINPSASWRPSPQDNPTFHILLLLAANIGLPFLVLSATGPLLQHWFSQLRPGVSPYRLYALSNIGSLGALLAFPFLLEPALPRASQGRLWGAGLIAFVLLCGTCAWMVFRHKKALPNGTASAQLAFDPPSSTTFSQRLLWFLLPACASVLLLAVTNKLCQDIAVVPFLWVLPLALYLLSFIVAFDSPRWYVRAFFGPALIVALGALCYALFRLAIASVLTQVAVYCLALFVCCMVCHGELYRLRPAPADLTAFYLVIAVGGAFGGLFVGVAAPLLFNDYFELHLGLFACGFLFWLITVIEKSSRPTHFSWDNWRTLSCLLPILAFIVLDRFLVKLGATFKPSAIAWLLSIRIGMWFVFALIVISWVGRGKFRTFVHWRFMTILWLTPGLAGLGFMLGKHAGRSLEGRIYKSRSFYGVLTLYEHERDKPANQYRVLQHGRITHGMQFVNEPRSTWPTTYYGETSGVSLALAGAPSIDCRVGVVGLGAGTLACYGQFGDSFRFYEINPEVIRVAGTRFSYLLRTPADIHLALGDARLSMEQEPAQDFDVLVLDAFSSDSIPVHLLTREAFLTYKRHLRPGGVIAIHTSNRFLNLEPVVAEIAKHFQLHCAVIDDTQTSEQWWNFSSLWMLLSEDPQRISSFEILSHAGYREAVRRASFPLWTDEFTSLYPLLK